MQSTTICAGVQELDAWWDVATDRAAVSTRTVPAEPAADGVDVGQASAEVAGSSGRAAACIGAGETATAAAMDGNGGADGSGGGAFQRPQLRLRLRLQRVGCIEAAILLGVERCGCNAKHPH